jgi:hypothetical protein
VMYRIRCASTTKQLLSEKQEIPYRLLLANCAFVPTPSAVSAIPGPPAKMVTSALVVSMRLVELP